MFNIPDSQLSIQTMSTLERDAACTVTSRERASVAYMVFLRGCINGRKTCTMFRNT